METTQFPELPQHKHAILSEAYNAIDANAIKLLSLDVSDTLLFRRCKNRSDVLFYQHALLIEKKLIPLAMDQWEWFELRSSAEEEARKKATNLCREVSIEEIYTQIPKSMLKEKNIHALIHTEIEAEKTVIEVDPYIAQLILYAAKKDLPYICVSNTFYNTEQLKDLISFAYKKQKNILPNPLFLFASSDFRENKNHKLFSIILGRVYNSSPTPTCRGLSAASRRSKSTTNIFI